MLASSGPAYPRSRIPVFVPCFNNLTYLTRMLGQLRRLGFDDITVIDNASGFQPLLSYLDSLEPEITVVREIENRGPHELFLNPEKYASLPRHFCLTDPDLEFNPELPAEFLAQLIGLTERYGVGKAGFGLEISDKDKMSQDDFLIGGRMYKIWEWEAKFWTEALPVTDGGDPVYRALVDTTFALYDKRYFNPAAHRKAVRIAGRYTCRHLPWYRVKPTQREEEELYRATAKFSHFLYSVRPGGDASQRAQASHEGGSRRPVMPAAASAKIDKE